MDENTFPHRYVIINIETGEILDDAQGYGFTTAKKAYAAFYWKNRSNETKQKEQKMIEFFISHKSIMDDLESASFYALKDNVKLEENDIIQIFKNNNIEFSTLPFTSKEVLKKWYKLDFKSYYKNKEKVKTK